MVIIPNNLTQTVVFRIVKVLIVGGGPAGSLSAIALRNHEVTIVEEHCSAGFPVQCAGLISDECYKGLKRFSKAKLNDIRGALVFSPSGRFAELVGRKKAVVMERKILDRDLLVEASKYAEVLVKTKFIGIEDGKALLRGMRGEFTLDFDVIVGADGVGSKVARTFDFERPEVLTAVQIECKFEPIDEKMVEIYFGKSFSEGFFAYSIPLGDGTARVGVISRSKPIKYLNSLMRGHVGRRMKGESVLELNVGAVPIGLVNFVKARVVLVGDSAGMVKPYTGGGLYYILRATELLGRTFPNLEAFKKEFMKDVGKEISAGMRLYKLYSKLSDEDYEYIVQLIGEHSDLAKSLDMDRPTTLLKILPMLLKLVKRPRLMRKLFALVV